MFNFIGLAGRGVRQSGKPGVRLYADPGPALARGRQDGGAHGGRPPYTGADLSLHQLQLHGQRDFVSAKAVHRGKRGRCRVYYITA